MLSDTSVGREFVNQVSLEVVKKIAPEELKLFAELAEEYYADPTPPTSTEKSMDDELAFGFETVLIPVSHAVLNAVVVVLGFLTTEVLKETKVEITDQLKEKIKALFQVKKLKSKQVPPLTKDELNLVKKLARKQAREFGLETADARKLADALVGALATI